jgi:hypothetical protein
MARSLASASACASSFNSANCAVLEWWFIGGVLGGAAMHPIESEYSMDRTAWLFAALILFFVAASVVRYPSDARLQAAVQRLAISVQESGQRIADAWQRVAE